MTGMQAFKLATNERRADKREALVLRIGAIACDQRTSFCLVKNVSAAGMQVKLYGRINEGQNVSVRVGDEDVIEGRIAWTRDQLAGIAFTEELPAEALLRVAQKLAPAKRRSLPRINAKAKVLIRTGGQCCLATLSDVSAMGARVKLSSNVLVGASAMITLPGMPAMRAFIRWQDGSELGLAFENPVPVEIMAQWLNERVGLLP